MVLTCCKLVNYDVLAIWLPPPFYKFSKQVGQLFAFCPWPREWWIPIHVAAAATWSCLSLTYLLEGCHNNHPEGKHFHRTVTVVDGTVQWDFNFVFLLLTYMDRPRPECEPLLIFIIFQKLPWFEHTFYLRFRRTLFVKIILSENVY